MTLSHIVLYTVYDKLDFVSIFKVALDFFKPLKVLTPLNKSNF